MISHLASNITFAAEPIFTPENVGVASTLITAVVAGVATIVGARTRSKLDALGQAIHDRDEARAELAAEKEARKNDRVEMQAGHDAAIERLDRQVLVLEARVEDRDRRINSLDRMVLAFRRYVAKLSGRLADNNIDVPDRPVELNE